MNHPDDDDDGIWWVLAGVVVWVLTLALLLVQGHAIH